MFIYTAIFRVTLRGYANEMSAVVKCALMLKVSVQFGLCTRCACESSVSALHKPLIAIHTHMFGIGISTHTYTNIGTLQSAHLMCINGGLHILHMLTP